VTVAEIRGRERARVITMALEHLANEQGFPTDDIQTIMWRRGWEDCTAWIALNCKQ